MSICACIKDTVTPSTLFGDCTFPRRVFLFVQSLPKFNLNLWTLWNFGVSLETQIAFEIWVTLRTHVARSGNKSRPDKAINGWLLSTILNNRWNLWLDPLGLLAPWRWEGRGSRRYTTSQHWRQGCWRLGAGDASLFEPIGNICNFCVHICRGTMSSRQPAYWV